MKTVARNLLRTLVKYFALGALALSCFMFGMNYEPSRGCPLKIGHEVSKMKTYSSKKKATLAPPKTASPENIISEKKSGLEMDPVVILSTESKEKAAIAH